MQHYAEMRVRDTELIPLAVWSPEDPDPPPMIGGWAYIEMPNQPLGRKWNAGVKALLSLDVDALVIIGSDDFLSSTYLDIVQEQLKRGAQLISVRDAFVYIPPDDTVAYIESVSSGAGRVVTRRTIELLKGRLWDDDARAFLDSSIMHRLRQIEVRRHNARNMGERGFAMLDVKMKEGPNIWRLVWSSESNSMVFIDGSGTILKLRRVTNLPARQFFKDYFPHLANYKALGTGEPYATQ